MTRDERRKALFRPELFEWSGPGREPAVHKFMRLGAEASIAGNEDEARHFFERAQIAEHKLLRGEREPGRPPGASRKPYRYQQAIDWALAEAARTGGRNGFALALKWLHHVKLPEAMDNATRLASLQKSIGEKIQKALRQLSLPK